MYQRILVHRPKTSLLTLVKFRTPIARRTLIAPPTQSSGPLLERRADRDLPPLPPSALRKWATTLPIFITIIAVSAFAIFNYEKSSSSVVNSTLYALRTNPEARRLLGNEIYFRDNWPWIWGELNQLHGRIDIGYAVKGSNGSGFMRFKSFRKGRMGYVRYSLLSLIVREVETSWSDLNLLTLLVQNRRMESGA